jgi:hypothetical protein
MFTAVILINVLIALVSSVYEESIMNSLKFRYLQKAALNIETLATGTSPLRRDF